MTNKIILGIVALAVVSAGVYFTIMEREPVPVTTFEECAAAGYPVMEIFPEQCRTPDGVIFVRNVDNPPAPVPPLANPKPIVCARDTKLCPDGSYVGRTGPNCAFAPCPRTGCTEEAKLCPDGSYVGRTGPNCAFAPCPSTTNVKVSTTARLGERVLNNGVYITPLEVTRDNRCPVSPPGGPQINCIWAGTVLLNTRLERNGRVEEFVFDSNMRNSATIEGKTVTLTEVSPEAGSVSSTNSYVFTFLVN